jgi:multiple sugar transport system permease protein
MWYMMQSQQTQARTRAETIQRLVLEIKGLKSQPWGEKLGYIFIAPAVLLYVVFQGWPIVRGLTIAFQDYRWLIPDTQGFLTSFNGLENFIEMVNDGRFWESLVVALKFTAMTVPSDIALALFAAVMIARVKNPYVSGFYRVIIYLPVVLPISTAMLLWGRLFAAQFGYLNVIISFILGGTRNIFWLGPGLALPSVAIASVWKSFGYNTLLFLIGIYNINSEIYEAAAIDGANAWKQFLHITLPLLKPIFTLILVLNAGIISATEQMMILTNGGPGYETTTIGLYAYRQAFTWGDMRMGYAGAMNLMLGLVSMLLSMIVFKALRTEKN